MISFLVGKVKNLSEKSVTILTSSGVGYLIYSPINTLLSLEKDQNLELFVHTVVKDDAIDLYGFLSENELFIFEKLITVSGVGPRSALNILSVTSTQNIALAVENGDIKLLSNIPGVGKKSCEKIIIELKGKLSNFLKLTPDFKTDKDTADALEELDAKSALEALGYSEKDISLAMQSAKQKENFKDKKAGELIKVLLKYLR